MNGTESKPTMAQRCPECGATLPGGALAGLCPACLLRQGAAADTATRPAVPPFEPPPLEDLKRLFPQLEVLALLGKGGMGAVYKARQPALDRLVALKILPAQTNADTGFAERFAREARALARLSHPNIVALYEFGQVDSLHYFIMEFVDGVNLRQLEKTRRLSPREALQLVPQICDALQYAHDEGVVHRDIKPENVLVDRKGRIKIADFGLAKILGRETADLRLTNEGQVMGTPHYMAPEQVEHPLEVDHRADIYSLGVVFYEMLTGELPLGKFAPPSRKVEVDIRLDDVVLHALEKEPGRRYQHAGEVKTAVEGIASGAPQPARASAPNAPAAPAWAMGVDYKSRASLFGWPLVHVATGADPVTGKRRVAKGIFALGNTAIGVFAAGGVAIGGVAVGGLGIGVLGIGGLALGLLAFGGLAIGLVAAIGGAATAPVAMGGGAAGYYAYGGGAWGAHTFSGLGVDPGAWDFFTPWAEPLLERTFTFGMFFAAAIILLNALVPLWLQRRNPAVTGRPHAWVQAGVALVCALGCIIPPLVISPLLHLPRLNLVSGTVIDGQSGQALAGALIRQQSPNGSSRNIRSDESGRFAFVVGGQKPSFEVSAEGFRTNALQIYPAAFARKRHASVRVPLGVVSRASEETWEPANKSTSPSSVLEEAQALTAAGKQEEALQRFVWYFNHALEIDRGQSGVRLTFALSYWTELGRRYPKAREALVEIRSRDRERFETGNGYFDLFMELAALDRELEQPEKTLVVFDSLEKKDRKLAEQCFLLVEEQLLNRGEYERCMNYYGDYRSRFRVLRDSWQRLKEFDDRNARLGDDLKRRVETAQAASARTNAPIPLPPPRLLSPPRHADQQFVGGTCKLIEVLLGTGHSAEAEAIQKEALALVKDPLLETAVADAQKRVQSHAPK